MTASMCISPISTIHNFGQYSCIAIGFFPVVLSGGCFDPLQVATAAGGHGSDLAAVCLVLALGKFPLAADILRIHLVVC